MENFIRTYRLKDTNCCDQLIDWYETNKDKARDGCSYSGEEKKITIDENIKESKDISMMLEEMYKVPGADKILDFLWESVNLYIKEFDIVQGMRFSLVEGINIQKYTPPTGGYKLWHHERTLGHERRLLVWMVYLNTVNDKGGTEFKYLKHTENAEQGKLVIWPADWTGTHRGIVSPTEIKYIMTGWYSLIS